MAGIYIHIPYCLQACHYCNFHFSTSRKSVPDMVLAIGNELQLRQAEISEPIETIYFGGGTPSILESKQISFLLNEVTRNFQIVSSPEITLEANPEDLSLSKTKSFRDQGVNRISLGVQSFDDPTLKFLNRSHDSAKIFSAVENLFGTGIDNINMDLIYGIPGQSRKTWQRNLKKMLQLKPKHISAYALTIEQKTVFGNWQSKGKLDETPEEDTANQFEDMLNEFSNAGFEHYEVSNFALEEYRSKHNTAYWQGEPYLGVGPGAHSFNNTYRRFNVANNASYLDKMAKGHLAYEEEILTKEQQLNEYLLTRLRTKFGIKLQFLTKEFDYVLSPNQFEYVQQLSRQGLVNFDGENLILTSKGFLLSDSIILKLMP